MYTKECLLHNAVKALRQDILDYESSFPDLPWPPQVETLKAQVRYGKGPVLKMSKIFETLQNDSRLLY